MCVSGRRGLQLHCGEPVLVGQWSGSGRHADQWDDLRPGDGPERRRAERKNTEIKRFDLECESRMGGWSSENVMNECDNGDWIRYEDPTAVVAALASQ